MTLDIYLVVALASIVGGVVLVLRGGRWPWRLVGGGLVALGLAMFYLLSGAMLITM